MAIIDDAIEAYVAFFEELTPGSLDLLETLCTPDVRFRDPFNDVRGLAAMRRVFEKMFEDVREPRFVVTDRAVSGQVCYLRWEFTFLQPRGGAPWRILGMTEVHFDESGRVAAHLDHWDSGSQLYARLPVLGTMVRWVRRRLSVEP